ncbi:MAG: hypothetical protein JSU57_01350 [Candidatus Heimdallarchaeota archaeon]|nr:MAG: hypothetical protein JSU57_01350 [Candidatus Heimdallarchaeota archaeon]
MPRKRSRKTLLEISSQPELWIFSNLLAEDWVTNDDLEKPVFEKTVSIPISLPSGTTILKLESDGLQGQVISMAIVHGSEIQLFQLMDPSSFSKFQHIALEYVKKIYANNFDFYSYLKSFYSAKMREFGISEVLGLETNVKDLADYGVKSRILQRISDPIQGYEVPQYWRVIQRLTEITPKNEHENRLILNLRTKVCDSLSKHAVIEGLRCAIIALKHYADLLDGLTSETRINPPEEHQSLADGLYELGNFQDSAVFFSKCLSQKDLLDKTEQDRILTALKDSIEQLEPQDFLEYALFAAKIARNHTDE